MSTLTPKIAAELAREVYVVQSQTEHKVHLKAEVGSRLINTKDGFGVCALGGKRYTKDIFIIFRG